MRALRCALSCAHRVAALCIRHSPAANCINNDTVLELVAGAVTAIWRRRPIGLLHCACDTAPQQTAYNNTVPQLVGAAVTAI
jgi:hypothetical protein